VAGPATQRIVAGEIYDYEVMSEGSADWRMILVDPLEPANVSTFAIRFR